MAALEQITLGAFVRGILPDTAVEIVSAKWHGSDVVEVVYKDAAGRPFSELLYRDKEPTLDIVTRGRPWSFDGDGALFRLVSEAHRIRLAHLFDPVLAVHTSVVEPLPHQITAVYEQLLPRQPLRFLLADDPGAGKTIMAGLLIKELIARGDLQRCLVVCPGSLAEQWQDELYRRFHLPFEILTNDKLEAARTGNWFLENHLVIARLDKLSRNEDVQAKLSAPDSRWDLIVCDEAHKIFARSEIELLAILRSVRDHPATGEKTRQQFAKCVNSDPQVDRARHETRVPEAKLVEFVLEFPSTAFRRRCAVGEQVLRVIPPISQDP